MSHSRHHSPLRREDRRLQNPAADVATRLCRNSAPRPDGGPAPSGRVPTKSHIRWSDILLGELSREPPSSAEDDARHGSAIRLGGLTGARLTFGYSRGLSPEIGL